MAATTLKLNRAGTMLTCPHLLIKRFLTPKPLLPSFKAGSQYKLLPFNFRFYSTSRCLLHSSPSGYIDTYEENFKQALQDPTTFWAKAAEDLIWHKKWHQVLDDSNPPWTQW